jgi:molecular chaperone GrpE (heat shock protein)
MNEQALPRIARWPFFVGDLLLLTVATVAVYQSSHPLGLGQVWLCFCCVLAGAGLSVAPFLLEYRAAEKLAQSGNLKTAVDQIQNLELISCQVGTALAQFHTLLEECAKTVSVSGSMGDRITAEAKSFQEFLEKANDAERANQRLEIEKMRRAETDWLQVTTGILDHVFALNQAAARSGQPELAHQIGMFQRACRDLARRVGLVPYAPEENQPYDPNLHHLADAAAGADKQGSIVRVLASGYTYQGQLIRRALVSVGDSGGKISTSAPPAESQAQAPESVPGFSEAAMSSGATGEPKSESNGRSIAETNPDVQKDAEPSADKGVQQNMLL